MILWLDLETYSETPITDGAYKYAGMAKVLLFSYAIDDAPARVCDVAHGEPLPDDVEAALRDPSCTLIAHNAQFDRTILKMYRPVVADPRRWKDSMIKAYSLSLPGSLGDLCAYFGLPTDKAKDKEGKALIQKFCLPRKSVSTLFDDADDLQYLPSPDNGDWQKFMNYARLDVEAMREIWKRMPSWNDTPEFWAEWHIDQDINDRGMRIDTELARCAVEACADAAKASNRRVREITNGAVNTAGQRDALIEYLNANGVPCTDLKKSSLEALLDDPSLPDDVRELVLVRCQGAKASVKKYDALLRSTCADGRLRGCLLFCGAQKTGRWAGRLFQPQNLPRGTLTPDQVEIAIDGFKHGMASTLYNGVPSVAASCLRGTIIAPPGEKLVVADLSNIEGRVLAWIAGEQWKLDAFRAYDRGEGVDLYKATYARTFGVKPEDVTKKQRQIGKVLELAMGYMGGVGSFLAFATMYGVDLKVLAEHTYEALPKSKIYEAHDQWDFFSKKGATNDLDEDTWTALNAIKLAWRDAHPAIRKFWDETELRVGAAFDASCFVPPSTYPCTFYNTTFGLACRLPSGRVMAYPRAELAEDGERCLFKYYAPLRVRKGFAMCKTHAGKIVENCLSGAILTLTRDRGWVPLRKVANTDELFDGSEWVSHGGVVSKGIREVVRVYGEWMTPDHKVLTTEGFKNARESKGFDRYDGGVPDGYEIPSGRRTQFDMGGALRGLRWNSRDRGQRLYKARKARCCGVVRVYAEKDNFLEKQKARYVSPSCVCDMAFHEGTMRNTDLSDVQELRRTGNQSVRAVEQFVRGVLGGHGADIQAWSYTGPNRQRHRLHAGQLPMGGLYRSGKQPPEQSHGWRRNCRAIREARRREIYHHSLSACTRCPRGAVRGGSRHYTEVFDVINCGPRNCFMVWAGGAPLIVHNCTQAVARDVLAANLKSVEDAGYKIVLSVHDELITETPDTPDYCADKLASLMATPPDWAADLPLSAAGFEAYRYKKD